MLYFPTHINIETSDACNRRCDFCSVPRRRGRPRRLDPEAMARLLVELRGAPWPLKVALQWGDEPLANPDFLDYLRLGQVLLPQATWLLQTNGELLTAEAFERLRHAFHAVTVNLYSARAAARFAALDLDCVPSSQPGHILHPGNVRRARGFAHRRHEAIVHVNHKHASEAWIERPVASRAGRGPCTHLWRDAALGHDGQLYLCCRDSARAHPAGDLRRRSLVECYNGAEARQLRARMQRGAAHAIAMCRRCPVVDTRLFDALQPEQAVHAAAARPAAPAIPRTSVDALRLARARDPADAQLESGQMPWGRYDYWSARALARELGHVALPGYLPRRYEYVVGLTPELARHIVETLRALLGPALRALWICGSRVMTRAQLQLVDPSVFEGAERGTLPHRGRGRLRELGPDARVSSDLDLKVLLAEGAVPEAERPDLERRLGELLDAASPHFPLSGHAEPRHRLWPIPAACADARASFRCYNRRRRALLGRGPHSREAAVLLYDAAAPAATPQVDAQEPVRASLLAPRRDRPRVKLGPLALGRSLAALDEGARLRARHRGLSGHQLIGALLDFPDREPAGVRLTRAGAVRTGALAVWAAQRAGRQSIVVE